jgi:hypothetical protein
MAMKSITSVRLWSLIFGCMLALLVAACGSVESSPTGPSPSPAPTPAPAPAPAPSPSPSPSPAPSPGRLEISINPNPVPWSDQSTSACGSDRPNRWFWDQILRNTGGTAITLTERVNYFNGDRVSTVSDNTTIQPGAEFRRATIWCSALNEDHTFRTDYSGSDSSGNRIEVAGPTVTLRKR